MAASIRCTSLERASAIPHSSNNHLATTRRTTVEKRESMPKIAYCRYERDQQHNARQPQTLLTCATTLWKARHAFRETTSQGRFPVLISVVSLVMVLFFLESDMGSHVPLLMSNTLRANDHRSYHRWSSWQARGGLEPATCGFAESSYFSLKSPCGRLANSGCVHRLSIIPPCARPLIRAHSAI